LPLDGCQHEGIDFVGCQYFKQTENEPPITRAFPGIVTSLKVVDAAKSSGNVFNPSSEIS